MKGTPYKTGESCLYDNDHHGDFQPCFDKTDVKKRDTNHLSHCIGYKNFRINEIASRLPVAVKHHKTKQKRLLRFLARRFPIGAAMGCWLVFVLRRVCQPDTGCPLILIDETQVLGNFKAIVAAVPFRHRALPIY